MTAVVSQDVYVRCSAANPTADPQAPFSEDGVRIMTGLTPGAAWSWHAPASGVAYELRVVNIGDNGTTASGDWTA